MNGFEKETEPDDGVEVMWGISFHYRGFYIQTALMKKNGLTKAFAKNRDGSQDLQSDWQLDPGSARAQVCRYIDKFAESV